MSEIDIVKRLRQTRADMLGTADGQHYYDCHEAADEIDRLRAELAGANGRVHAAELHAAGIHTQRDEAIRDRDAAAAERDELRELLREASVYLDDVDGTGPLDLQCRIDAALKGENE